jgi:hypothetical protein
MNPQPGKSRRTFLFLLRGLHSDMQIPQLLRSTLLGESVIKSVPWAVLGKAIMSRLLGVPQSRITISLFHEGTNRKTQLLLFTPRADEKPFKCQQVSTAQRPRCPVTLEL